MKNKIFGIIAVLVVVLVAFLNVNIGINTNKKLDITLADIEALADREWAWNNILDWWDYGLRADEKIRETACTNNTTTTGNGSTSTTNIPNGKKKTCETGGNINCDPCNCC